MRVFFTFSGIKLLEIPNSKFDLYISFSLLLHIVDVINLENYFIPGDAVIIVNIDLNNWLIVLTILNEV